SMVKPCSEGKVTTTTWSELLSSSALSSASSSARSAALNRSALSTIRLVSCGYTGSAAAAGPMQKMSAKPKRIRRHGVEDILSLVRPFPLELHLRHLGGLLGDGEVLHGLGIGIEHRAPPASGDGSDLGVVGLDRFDVVAPGDGDAVFGAFELRLQRKEILVRLQVRIILHHR